MIAKKIRHFRINIVTLLCITILFYPILNAKSVYEQENKKVITNSDIFGDWNIRLIDVNGILIYPPMESESSRIQINNNQIVGVSGCNNFMVGYTRQGPRQISIGHGAATKKMCAPEVMNFEDIFLQNFTGLFNIEHAHNGIYLVRNGVKVYLIR